jgi:hypothetical protein
MDSDVIACALGVGHLLLLAREKSRYLTSRTTMLAIARVAR